MGTGDNFIAVPRPDHPTNDCWIGQPRSIEERSIILVDDISSVILLFELKLVAIPVALVQDVTRIGILNLDLVFCATFIVNLDLFAAYLIFTLELIRTTSG